MNVLLRLPNENSSANLLEVLCTCIESKFAFDFKKDFGQNKKSLQ